MLREIRYLRGAEGVDHRRWFSDEYFDLIVNYDAEGEIASFDLCYGKPDHEHVLLWDRESGFRHSLVDDGEGRSGRYKMSPIYLPDGTLDRKYLLMEFEARSGDIDPGLREFVIEKIRK